MRITLVLHEWWLLYLHLLSILVFVYFVISYFIINIDCLMLVTLLILLLRQLLDGVKYPFLFPLHLFLIAENLMLWDFTVVDKFIFQTFELLINNIFWRNKILILWRRNIFVKNECSGYPFLFLWRRSAIICTRFVYLVLRLWFIMHYY